MHINWCGIWGKYNSNRETFLMINGNFIKKMWSGITKQHKSKIHRNARPLQGCGAGGVVGALSPRTRRTPRLRVSCDVSMDRGCRGHHTALSPVNFPLLLLQWLSSCWRSSPKSTTLFGVAKWQYRNTAIPSSCFGWNSIKENFPDPWFDWRALHQGRVNKGFSLVSHGCSELMTCCSHCPQRTTEARSLGLGKGGCH